MDVIDVVVLEHQAEVERVRRCTEADVRRYVAPARRMGLAAEHRMSVGVDVLDEAERLCREIAGQYPHAVFFTNRLLPAAPPWYYRLLHRDTAYQLQRRLQCAGLQSMVLPVRVFSGTGAFG